MTAQSVRSFPLDPLLLSFPWRKRSRQVSLVSTTLSAPLVGEELRDRRAERECDAGLRARAGSGRSSPQWGGRGRLVSCSVWAGHVLADLLYQLLVRQAVEAVDGQV